ncbi:Os11g0526000, partial [Oryza sativa Japonica Group]
GPRPPHRRIHARGVSPPLAVGFRRRIANQAAGSQPARNRARAPRASPPLSAAAQGHRRSPHLLHRVQHLHWPPRPTPSVRHQATWFFPIEVSICISCVFPHLILVLSVLSSPKSNEFWKWQCISSTRTYCYC